MKTFCHLLAITAMLSAPAALAQVAITAITTSTSDTANTTADTPAVTFENTTLALSSFTANSNIYQVTTLANQAYARRATGIDNPNQSSVWYRDGVTSGDQLGSYSTNYASLLLNNNLSGGSDNTFANGTSGSHVAQDGNIERLDFVFTGGLVATSSMVFAVFERGAVNVHDLFRISVITGWNSGTSTPTSYSTLVGASASSDWGTTNLVPDFAYHLFRYNTGDDLTTSTAHTETNTQGLGGIMFTMAQLGITPGTTIYGYSLFGNDVTNGGNSANLLDYTNTTYFPSDTSGATGTGGIDLATINGLAFTAIPEPATYALGGLVVMAGAVVWHRRRAHA